MLYDSKQNKLYIVHNYTMERISYLSDLVWFNPHSKGVFEA